MIRKRRNRNRKLPSKPKVTNRVNEQINESVVQLVGDNVEVGMYPIFEALNIAQTKGLDLVEMSITKEGISICRVIDFKKFAFDKRKKNREIQSRNKTIESKEIRFTPSTDEHDFEFKAKHAQHFLQEGFKLKVMVQFKGRTIIYQNRGVEMIQKLLEYLEEDGTLEGEISVDRRRMHAVVAPFSKNRKKQKKASNI